MSRWRSLLLVLTLIPILVFGQSEKSGIHDLLSKELKDPLHGVHHLEKDSTKHQTALFKNITRSNDFEVFGWYPYWNEDLYAGLEYELLSTIAYYGYQINPRSGKSSKEHRWSDSPMLDSARAYEVKLLLVATNYGEKNNTQFLSDTKARTKFTQNILQLLDEGKGEGVCLDFEGVTKQYKDSLSAFVKQLKESVTEHNTSWKVYLTLPLKDSVGAYDLKKLSPYVDRFVVAGYAYHAKGSETAGPISPLNGLKKNVTAYRKDIPADKLIVGLPLYGMMWESHSEEPQSKAKKYLGARSLDYITKKTSKIPTQFDTISESPYKVIPMDRLGKEYRLLWFENEQSFAAKLDYITSQKLAGVGVWALGDDLIEKSVWKEIDSALTKEVSIQDTLSFESELEQEEAAIDSLSATSPIDKLILQLEPIEEILAPFVRIKTILVVLLVLLTLFIGIGFLAALLYPDTRQYFFNSTTRKVLLILGLFFLVITILRIQNWITDISLLVLASFMLGAVGMNLINFYLSKIKNNLP